MGSENPPQPELSRAQRVARVAGAAVLGGLLGVGLIEGIAYIVPHHHTQEANRIDADATFGGLWATVMALKAHKRYTQH